jgi:hypothetical protein
MAVTGQMAKRPGTRRNPLRLFTTTHRAWCLGATLLYSIMILLWFFTWSADALAGMSDVECSLLLQEFRKTFVQPGDGYPTIDSCDTQIVRLMWQQQITRVYSTSELHVDTYQQLRSLPDKQFAKLVVNAAAGSLLDSTQTASDDALMRIRVNSHGHFQRYVLNDTSRITALQTMLVLSIVTLAVTWWRLSTGQDGEKSA